MDGKARRSGWSKGFVGEVGKVGGVFFWLCWFSGSFVFVGGGCRWGLDWTNNVDSKFERERGRGREGEEERAASIEFTIRIL